MKKKIIGVLTFLAAAGASVFALSRGALNSQTTPPAADTPTPTVSAETQPCGYVWAYQNLPDISAELQTAIQQVLPEATARAQAFGENCVAADGSATFGAMETDFYVTIPVKDVTDDATLGNLIEQVLQVTDSFARPRVPGGQDGFVEFTFQAGDQRRVLRVPIPRGAELRQQGLHGAELMQALETP